MFCWNSEVCGGYIGEVVESSEYFFILARFRVMTTPHGELRIAVYNKHTR